MPQIIIYLDKEEDDKINLFSQKYKLSKVDAVKTIIRNFKEDETWVY